MKSFCCIPSSRSLKVTKMEYKRVGVSFSVVNIDIKVSVIERKRSNFFGWNLPRFSRCNICPDDRFIVGEIGVTKAVSSFFAHFFFCLYLSIGLMNYFYNWQQQGDKHIKTPYQIIGNSTEGMFWISFERSLSSNSEIIRGSKTLWAFLKFISEHIYTNWFPSL